jgi:hypothetical protein
MGGGGGTRCTTDMEKFAQKLQDYFVRNNILVDQTLGSGGQHALGLFFSGTVASEIGGMTWIQFLADLANGHFGAAFVAGGLPSMGVAFTAALITSLTTAAVVAGGIEIASFTEALLQAAAESCKTPTSCPVPGH